MGSAGDSPGRLRRMHVLTGGLKVRPDVLPAPCRPIVPSPIASLCRQDAGSTLNRFRRLAEDTSPLDVLRRERAQKSSIWNPDESQPNEPFSARWGFGQCICVYQRSSAVKALSCLGLFVAIELVGLRSAGRLTRQARHLCCPQLKFFCRVLDTRSENRPALPPPPLTVRSRRSAIACRRN